MFYLRFKKISIICLAGQCALLSQVSFASTLDSKPKSINLKQEMFKFKLQAFWNTAHSGIPGEQYLREQRLSNTKLFTDIHLSSWLKIHSLLVHNPYPTPINSSLYFDEAFIAIRNPQITQWSVNLGRKWIPFGNYRSDLIYKPITKSLGQTNEYVMITAYENKNYYASVSLFPPLTKIQNSNSSVFYTLDFGLTHKKENQSYIVGASYINSLAEGQLFQFNKGFGGFWDDPRIKKAVPAIAAYTNLKYKQWNAYFTYVFPTTSFDPRDMNYQNKGASPRAFSAQVGYEFKARNTPLKVIAFYDESFEALALRVPKKRLGLGFNVYLNPHVDLQLQYFKDYAYETGTKAGGLGKTVLGDSKRGHTLALQIALSFM